MAKSITVLLDAGGVIIDETDIESYYAELISSIISEKIMPYTIDDYRRDLGDALNSYCSSVYRYILWKQCNPDLRLYHDLWEQVAEDKEKNRPSLKLSEGISDELEILSKSLKIGIAGQYGTEIIDLLRAEKLIDYFDYPFTQDEFEITKPDPRFYEAILNLIGISADKAIMVGDRIDKDIAPAKYLGMKTVRIKTGIHINQKPRIPEEIPDLELNGINGMAAAILDRF